MCTSQPGVKWIYGYHRKLRQNMFEEIIRFLCLSLLHHHTNGVAVLKFAADAKASRNPLKSTVQWLPRKFGGEVPHHALLDCAPALCERVMVVPAEGDVPHIPRPAESLADAQAGSPRDRVVSNWVTPDTALRWTGPLSGSRFRCWGRHGTPPGEEPPGVGGGNRSEKNAKLLAGKKELACWTPNPQGVLWSRCRKLPVQAKLGFGDTTQEFCFWRVPQKKANIFDFGTPRYSYPFLMNISLVFAEGFKVSKSLGDFVAKTPWFINPWRLIKLPRLPSAKVGNSHRKKNQKFTAKIRAWNFPPKIQQFSVHVYLQGECTTTASKKTAQKCAKLWKIMCKKCTFSKNCANNVQDMRKKRKKWRKRKNCPKTRKNGTNYKNYKNLWNYNPEKITGDKDYG